MKRINFCGNRYQNLEGNWGAIYNTVMAAAHELGYEVRVSPTLRMNIPDFAVVGIEDNDDDIYVYNHTYSEDLKGFRKGSKTIFIKPTAPTPAHYTMDPEGYAAVSSITYNKPDYEGYDHRDFFEREAKMYLDMRTTKWTHRADLQFDAPAPSVPDDHVLVIGQMTGDETVTKMSFGDHWAKLQCIVSSLISAGEVVVVKVHPTLERESSDELWAQYKETIDWWVSKGVIVLKGFESLYDILPKTRVAIVENSTSGLECLMMKVPVITYGFPEYHWATHDLRHLIKLPALVSDLSWHNQENADQFTAWYFQQCLCKDVKSAKERLTTILALP